MALLLTCLHTTRLIEERAVVPLPFLTAAALAVHLAYCPLCKRYAVQSSLIAQMALFAAQRTLGSALVLPPAARRRIQQRLHAAGAPPAPDAEKDAPTV